MAYVKHEFNTGDVLTAQTMTEIDTEVEALDVGKVDVVEGYGLSKNDFNDVLLTKLNGIEENANKYVLPSDVVQDSSYSTFKSNFNTLSAKVPAQATSSNQLADKNFVNSSITTATATYRGQFTSLDELKKTTGDNNDYAFYAYTNASGAAVVDKYTHNGTEWTLAYTVNASGMTAAQLAATLSGITEEKVTKLDAIDDGLNLKASAHKANQTAITFTDAEGNTTTVYAHTANE